MKKFIFFLFLIGSFDLYSQSQQKVLEKANEYIGLKKYESAYQILNKFDSSNVDIDVVLLKTDLLLKYYVFSISHIMFTLKDLDLNEEIADYRGKHGFAGNMISFPADSILLRLIKNSPLSCKLYKGLGDYYYEVYQRYEDNWIIDSKELCELILTNHNQTIARGCADYNTYYSVGFFNLVQENYKESIDYFLKSIELKYENAGAHYNLAYAYYSKQESGLQDALKYYENALKLFSDSLNKSNSAFMMGHIFSELNNDEKALHYFELANHLNPYDKNTFTRLMEMYFNSGNNKFISIANNYFDKSPNSYETYNQLNFIFKSNDKGQDLLLFYKLQIDRYNDNKLILGNINFYLGLELFENDKKLAKEYLLASKFNFTSYFESKKNAGIGAQLSAENQNIIVTNIVEGSASYRQGDLEVGDIILKIAQGNENPIDVLNMNIDEILTLIRGKKGTEVKLTVKKYNNGIKTISIIRDFIPSENDDLEKSVIETINEKLEKCN
jgi:tetratricopeptide (TPR) repeat protein